MHTRLHTGKKEVTTDVDDRLRPTGRAAGGFAALPVSWPRQDFRIANTAPSKTHRFSSPWVGREAHGHSLQGEFGNQRGVVERRCHGQRQGVAAAPFDEQ